MNVGNVKGGKTTITSTLENEIDITPSSNHTSVNKNPGPFGEANTSVDILDADGNIAMENLKEIKECKMKGCLIRNDEISLIEVFDCIEDFDKYNWLITNIECYPLDEEISGILGDEYCWIAGKELLRLLQREDFQWIWGVFSAFSKDVTLEEVLSYNYPYADGYRGFWKNPITVQHPLAISEIVAWDGSIILMISKNNQIVNTFMENNAHAKDLEEYNKI